MATGKTGLDYFPLDTGFFDDDKIQFTGARFGLKGENIALRLLCKIFSQGYYYRWGEDEALLFAKRTGDGCDRDFVTDVVKELVRRDFFDKTVFEKYGILTSRGIQKRYLEATERRKRVEIRSELLLVDAAKKSNVHILPHNVDTGPENVPDSSQSKIEQKKPNQTEKEKVACQAPSLDEVEAFFTERGYPLRSARKAYEYYQAGQWKDSRGNPVLNWKQKMLSVWMNSDNAGNAPSQETTYRIPH